MDCRHLKAQIDRQIEGDLTPNETEELQRHLASCPDCSQYYRQTQAILEAITPTAGPKTPDGLKKAILSRAGKQFAHKTSPVRRPLWGMFSRIAAALAVLVGIGVVLLVTIQPVKAEIKLLKQSAERMERIKTVLMTIDVRTRPNDNFASIDAREPMLTHRLAVVPAERKWRLEKKGRILVSDGTVQHAWLPEQKFGWIDSIEADMAEGFSIFFDPRKILLFEIEAAKQSGTELRMSSTEDEIRLTVTAKAQGDFANDYMLNSSIQESDNRREYVFDRESELLKSVKVYIREKGTDILVLETTSIQYDTPIAPEVFTSLPEGYTWNDLLKPADSPLLKGLSAEETANKIFQALSQGDISQVRAALEFSDAQNLVKIFRGCTVLKWGKPFRSGQYPGVFLPCEIRLKNGKVKQYKIALRNDNPKNIWMLDGGI